ncbi:MAG TPA: hypothetical protein VF221_23235 [Chloroflexota bacterium]
MRIAGVRLPDGRAFWVDAGMHRLRPLDSVLLSLNGTSVQGTIFVAPEQLLSAVEVDEADLIEVLEADGVRHRCDDLPGAELPPLGSQLLKGTVRAIDPIRRQVTLQLHDGEEVTFPLAEALE